MKTTQKQKKQKNKTLLPAPADAPRLLSLARSLKTGARLSSHASTREQRGGVPPKMRPQSRPPAARRRPTLAAVAPRASSSTAFADLLAAAGATASVRLGPPSPATGRGLVASRDLAAGDAALTVPRAACVVVDYGGGGGGLQLPGAAAWPRTRAGVARDAGAPWDDLMALALLDAAAGDGGAWWGEYADALLPAPAALALPVTLPDRLLARLGDGGLTGRARAQRARLAAAFPGLAAPMLEGGNGDEADEVAHPTHMEWAFACVRSRAFALGGGGGREGAGAAAPTFAFVPFLDLANHAPDTPNADFGLSADGSTVRLVAVAPVAAGDEVTISYTGAAGATNARLMAQYGFALPSNPADRLEVDADLARQAAGVGEGACLDVDALLDAVGPAVANDVLRGRAPAIQAAIRSLPLGEGGGDTRALAGALAEQVEAQWAGE